MVDGSGLENRHTRKGIGGSNPSLSATQSAVQRNPPGFPSKLREMGGIARFLLANRTGESVLLVEAGKLCGPFLWRASERSGFHDSIARMQRDHKPVIKRKRLDFVGGLGRILRINVRNVRNVLFPPALCTGIFRPHFDLLPTAQGLT